MAPPEPSNPTEISEGISDELARIHIESYGQEPNHIKTHLLADSVVVEIDVDLMQHERTILEYDGDGESIRQVRSAYQEAIRSTYVAAVERMTGREVIGFISDTHLKPTFTLEYFKLAPHVT